MIARKIFNFICIFLLTFLFTFLVSDFWHLNIFAASVSWDGGAGTSNWEDALNWSTDVVPSNVDDVLIDQSVTVNISAGTTINSLVLGNSGGTTTPVLNFAYDSVGTSSPLVIDDGNLTIYSGGKITHSAGTTVVVGTVNINVQTGSVTVNSGGSIDVSGKGYTRSEGPGAGSDNASWKYGSGGGAYGGNGGSSSVSGGSAYGSITNPTDMGSGGGHLTLGGAGGGLVKLVVSDTLTLNGSINTNGNSATVNSAYSGGGGAGGGVNISVETFTGTGTISSNGGLGNAAYVGGGGGAGGRVAIQYTSNTFLGNILTNSGTGPSTALNGGSGTTYLTNGVGNGNLTVSTLTAAVSPLEGLTPISGTFDNVTVSGYSHVDLSSTLTISDSLSVGGTSLVQIQSGSTTTYGSISWTGSSKISDYGGSFPLVNDNATLTIPSGTTLYSNVARTYSSVTVSGTWSHWWNTTTQQYFIDVDITNDLTVNSGGSIDVSGKGYKVSEGPGAGTDLTDWKQGAGGGAYGGDGGLATFSGGVAYGSITNPTDMGSGGGYTTLGGPGGGLTVLNILGEFTLDGTINANGFSAGTGDAYAGGGGSGGGVNISTGVFTGGGSITANGGSGTNGGYTDGGGGSGGRIAIEYSSSTFSGTTLASGGQGLNNALNGGAGTIYLTDGVGNGNLTVATSTVPESSLEALTHISGSFDTVTISGYSHVDLSSTLTVSSALSIGGTSLVQIQSGSTTTYGSISWTDSSKISDYGGSFPLVNDNATLTIPSGTTLYTNVARTYSSVTVSGTWSHWWNTTTQQYILDVDITNDLTVNSGGSIDVSGKGYARSEGPGAGTDSINASQGSGGAGYGGDGGSSTYSGGVAYGSITNPTDMGSGGGHATLGGPGGGLTMLNILGTFTLEGTINANGFSATYNSSYLGGGGSGGGVNISVGAFTGGGSITSNGGSGCNAGGDGGGGSGGRIAIEYSGNTFSGTISANSGLGSDLAYNGGAGTIYLTNGVSNGNLTVSTLTAVVSPLEGLTPVSGTFDTVTISGYSHVDLSSTLTVSSALSIGGTSLVQIQSGSTTTYGSISWTDSSKISDYGGSFPLVNDNATLTIPSGTTLYTNVARTYSSVTVSGTWSHWWNTTTQQYILDVDITNDLTVNSGGSIDVSGKGYARSEGPGAGVDMPDAFKGSGGGAYGGDGGLGGSGGSAGGSAYGSITNPTDMGSGGGSYSTNGGAGGGLVKLVVSDTLILNGTINTNGSNGSTKDYRLGGGGSGGGVNISTGVFTGTGLISANGASGANWDEDGGGGGGGRVAILYSSNTFSGSISANGALGTDLAYNGGAGTVYLTDGVSNGDLIVSTPSVAVSLPEGLTPISGTYDSVTISGYAHVDLSGTLTISNTLSVGDNSFVQIQSTSTTTYGSISWTGSSKISDFGGSFPLVNDNATLTIPSGLTLYSNSPRTYSSVTVSGIWSHWENTTTQQYFIDVDITNDLIVNSGGNIDVSSKGYQYGEGPGAGTDGSGDHGAGGGGYGGNGGNGQSGRTGGVSNSSMLDPLNIGSAGGYSGYSTDKGGSGGGLVKLVVGGELNLEGNIYANGGTSTGGGRTTYWYAGGGGSGGGVNLTVNAITGAGSITANGTSGYNAIDADGGGGSGGRVAILYSSNTFTGSISVNGGLGPDSATDGEVGTIYLFATNSMPVASASNISILTHSGDIYAGHTYTYESIYSDVDGQSDLDKLYFRVENPLGDDIEMYASNSGTDLTDQTPVIVSGSEYISDATYSITPTYGTENEVKVTWEFKILWNWIESSNIEYGVKAVDLAVAESTYSYTDNDYVYENDLTFTGTLSVQDSESNTINGGDWILPSQTVYISGLTVVYENTTDIYPLDSDFNVTVTDTHSNFWADGISSGQPINISITSYSSTSSSEALSIDITDIPSAGSDVSSSSFSFKVDATVPTVSSLSSSTHPQSSTWYSSNIVTFIWETLDLESGIGTVYRYLSQTADEVSSTIRSSGVQTVLTEWTSEAIADGIWYFYLLVEDIVGNITLEDILVKIDTSIPDIVDVIGNYENVWQNVSNKPVISWTDPNSLSDDTVYITVDGTTPSSSNYAYATNQSTYTLSSLSDGEYTIKLIPKNGAGTYGLVRDFIFKYDSTAPGVVTNFNASVSSQNKVTLQWVNPLDTDFSKVVVKRDTTSLMNTAVVIYEGTGTTVTDSNLKGSTKYYYTVVSYDISGNISQSVSTDITTKDLTPPSSVSNFISTVSKEGVLLTWSNPADIDFDKVILYRNDEEIYSGSDTSYLDIITLGGEYIYYIVTYDKSGNTSSKSEIKVLFQTDVPKDVENKIENKKVVEANTGESIEIKIPIKELLRGGDIEDIDTVILVINDKEYIMKLSEDRKFFVAKIDTPETKGTYTMRAEAIKDGETVGTYDMHLEVSDNKDSDLQSPEYIKYIYIVGGVILAFIIIVILIKVSRRRKSFEE